MFKGSCLCGSVRFTVDGELSSPSVCHCGQCRRQAGHAWASTVAKHKDLTFADETLLGWFSASDIARRGFCRKCGSFLFWQHLGEDTISIAMGALDEPTGLKLARHIFVADKGDYYDIKDDLPQQAQ